MKYKLPSAARLGANVESLRLTLSGRRTGALHLPFSHVTFHRLPPRAGKLRPMKKPSSGLPPGVFGRLEIKTRKRPSGDMVASMSLHCPENGAVTGADQCPLSRWLTRMVESLPSLRVKYTVRPSGVNAGALSCSGPEITPGAKTVGVTSCARTLAHIKASTA